MRASSAYLQDRLQVLLQEGDVHQIHGNTRLGVQRNRNWLEALERPLGHKGQLLVAQCVVLRDAVFHEELAVLPALGLQLDLLVPIKVCSQLRLTRSLHLFEKVLAYPVKRAVLLLRGLPCLGLDHVLGFFVSLLLLERVLL